MKDKKRRRKGRGPQGGPRLATAAGTAAAASSQPKAMTVTMGGFDGLIHKLASVPLLVNRALPLLERGEIVKGADLLTDAVVQVELGKAAILGNLAFAAMKEGDIGKCRAYVEIALESMSAFGLDEHTELGKMLAYVHAHLPAEQTEGEAADPAAATAGGATTGSAAID